MAHVAVTTQARRVLIVDDEPLIRWSLAETLAERGYVVSEAGTAAEGARLATGAEPYDVILLDLRLPDATDLALFEQLRTVSPSSRIIMITAYGTAEIAERCHRLGAYQFVGKPFQLSDLVAIVDAAA